MVAEQSLATIRDLDGSPTKCPQGDWVLYHIAGRMEKILLILV
jgi:hypothetical protein